MNRVGDKLATFFFRFFLSVAFAGFALYSYLTEQNKCTELKMRLPKIAKEIEAINQDNAQLQYQIVCFESPDHLLQLAKNSEYAHLKFPYLQDVLTVKEGLALQWPSSDETARTTRSKSTVVVGANTNPQK
jgi:hypothetical protein